MSQTEIRFFNTNQSDRETLVKEIAKSISLEDRVLEFFKSRSKEGLIWSDVTTQLGIEVASYGSVKRSITNLMNRGLLYKSTNTKVSIFGSKAHYYFLNVK